MSLGVLKGLFESIAEAARCNPVTPAATTGVTQKSAPVLARTPVTPVTPPIEVVAAQAVRLYRLTPAQADRCHAPCWDDGEIAAFVQRHARLLALGFADGDADDLAERLTLRDRDHDDRRACIECRHHRLGRCANHRRAGLATPDLGRDLATLLQRCSAFASVGGKD